MNDAFTRLFTFTSDSNERIELAPELAYGARRTHNYLGSRSLF